MANIRRYGRARALPSAALMVALVACGGDDGPDGIPEDDPLARVQSEGRRASSDENGDDRGDGPEAAFASYEKVPEDLRRPFGADDFDSDRAGRYNRDPFQSFVVDDPLAQDEGDEDLDRDEICSDHNSIATGFALADLALMGIVLRGTTGYAMFRDSSGAGHIVRQGQCVGSEQAVVARVGSDYVTLEREVEGADDGEPAVEEDEILLHPEEHERELLPVGDGESP